MSFKVRATVVPRAWGGHRYSLGLLPNERPQPYGVCGVFGMFNLSVCEGCLPPRQRRPGEQFRSQQLTRHSRPTSRSIRHLRWNSRITTALYRYQSTIAHSFQSMQLKWQLRGGLRPADLTTRCGPPRGASHPATVVPKHKYRIQYTIY